MVFSKFFSFLSKLFPVRMISSVLYLGFLNVWQRYWASFLGLILVWGMVFYSSFLLKISVFSIYAPQLMIEIISPIFLLTFFLTFLGIISIFLYRFQEGLDEITIVIDAFLGPLWIMIIAFPAVLSLRDFGFSTVDILCNKTFSCSAFPYNLLGSIMMIVIPFVMFCTIDKIKFWPSETILGNFDGPFSRISDILISALYVSIFLYIFSFVFMKLDLIRVVMYLQGIFIGVYNEFIELFNELFSYLSSIQWLNILKKLYFWKSSN